VKLHFILHESFESPAAIENWAKTRGHETAHTRLYNGDLFPSVCDFDFLIIMGGPQSPTTTIEECPHFDSQGEILFIKKAINENKILLGVCLGAQLIGEALGAKFEHSPNREIGVFPITLTEDGKKDYIIGAFPEVFDVGHWHGDMPGLTAESKILATSAGCPRQIVYYTPKIYGFQCHFEFTPEAIEEMIKNNSQELEDYKNLPYIETTEQLKSHSYKDMNSLLFEFLDKISN
jgi:GMP synthase (glutamine-hydrolysing)